MRKLILTSLAAAALATSAFAINASAAPGEPPDGAHMQRTMEEHAVMFDAHLAGMKAALKLTPDQEKNWAPFEAAVREAEKARSDEMRQMHEVHDKMDKADRPSPIERMNEMSDGLAKASVELKKVADAAKPLFDSLDDQQKRHFGPLLMSLRERGPHDGPRGPWEHGPEGEMQ